MFDLLRATPKHHASRVMFFKSVSTRDQDFVAVDTETTGLAWHDRLVEIGAVRFRGDQVLACWRTLVDPQRPIPAQVSAIHGITDCDVRGAPTASEALDGLAAFSAGAVLLAHNARFDRDVLAASWVRERKPAPTLPMYCTWRLARHCLPEAPRHGLAALATYLALPTTSPHRALADAEFTRRLFLVCRDRLDARGVASLDAKAIEAVGPWSLCDGIARTRSLPPSLRALWGYGRRREPVTLFYEAIPHDAAGAITGVPLRALALGDDVVIELRDSEGREHSIEAARVRAFVRA